MQFTKKEKCKDEACDLRNQIVRFSLERIEETGFCVKDICLGMSISREAFYYHFIKRETLIRACASSFVVQGSLDKTFRNIVSYLSLHLSFFRKNLNKEGVRVFLFCFVPFLNGMSEDCGYLLLGYCYMLLSDSFVNSFVFKNKMIGLFSKLGLNCLS